MKSFERVKHIHGKDYLYRITPYYDKSSKKIKQRSTYIGPVREGKVVEKTAITYTYGDLIPVMKAVRDLKLDQILEKILKEYASTILVLAVNRIIRPESMNNVRTWYEDSYISNIYDVDLSSSTLSRVMESIGSMNPNHSFLREIIPTAGDTTAMYYDLTSFSSHSREMEFLEYGYSRSDPDLPQVNVSMVETRTGIPVFYDLYPGSVVDITTVRNTVQVLKSAGIKELRLIMDRGMFSTSNIEYLISENMDFIMPASFTLKGVKKLALLSRRTIERGSNIMQINGEIMFAMKHKLDIGSAIINTFVYYDQKRDSRERNAFYSSLYERIRRLEQHVVKKWEKPATVVEEIMSSYRNFISWRYTDKFTVKMKENAISQRINRCGITIITFTGDHDAHEILDEYRKRDSVEKLFLSSKSFTGAEPLRVHKIETLRGELFVNMIALAIRSRILIEMRENDLMKKYSVEKMILELQKLRKVILQDGKEITTEMTRKQKEILTKFSISLNDVPTFLKS